MILKYHKLFLMILFALFVPLAVNGQDSVTVSRQFFEDATRAFDLVVQQREALAKYAEERAASLAERQKAEMLIKALDELIEIKNRTLVAKDDLIRVYQAIIDTQAKIIDKLEKYINKPKGFWQKLAQTLKEIAILAGGILIGRGL